MGEHASFPSPCGGRCVQLGIGVTWVGIQEGIMTIQAKWTRAAAVLCLSAALLPAQDTFAGVQSRVTSFKLANGLTFIVLERRNAPVVSFYTYADVGSAQEVKGITGLAHMFEHMAFKGTTKI